MNVHFAFHHRFVFNGNFSSYFNNNKLFRKFKMGYGAFYEICPRASSQSVTPLTGNIPQQLCKLMPVTLSNWSQAYFELSL